MTFNEKILEEFDIKSKKENCWMNSDGSNHTTTGMDIEETREFISSALQRQIEKVMKAIPKKKILPKSVNVTSFPDDLIKGFRVEEQGFNKAISQLLSNLNKLK